METKTHQVRVTNRKLSRSAIVPATTFVEFKRKIVTELCMSGWLSVKVYKAESFEVKIIQKGNFFQILFFRMLLRNYWSRMSAPT